MPDSITAETSQQPLEERGCFCFSGSPPLLLKTFFEEDSRKDAKTQSLEIHGIRSLCDFASLRETSGKSTQLTESPFSMATLANRHRYGMT